MQVTTTNDPGLAWVNAVIYGAPGVGKTSLARTLPALGRTLIVSAEGGLKPLAGTGIDVWVVKNADDIGEAVATLQSDPKADYPVVFFDSLTEIGKLIEADIQARFVDTNPDTGLLEVPKQKNFAYYAALGREIEGFVRMMRDMPRHTIFSCLPKSWKDDNTGASGHRPLYGSSSFAEILPGLFDHVWCLRLVPNAESGEMQRVLFTSEHDTWAAKTRQQVDNPILPPAIADPDLSVILGALSQAGFQQGGA